MAIAIRVLQLAADPYINEPFFITLVVYTPALRIITPLLGF
jgi:hypothetical protein